MSGIYWIASYPKSGNTWFRMFLTNLRQDQDEAASINNLESLPIASAREPFDWALGYDSSDMTQEEIDLLRPEAYELMARRSIDPLFLKAHDAYTLLPNGRPLFPTSVTLGVVYLLRNPLDVCVSRAHHEGVRDFDRVIQSLANESNTLSARLDLQTLQLRQNLLSWSSHVSSWADAVDLRVLTIRYEDMKSNPLETFAAAAAFVGLPSDRSRVGRALELSSFDTLKRQEDESGFRERFSKATSFFRKGEVGSWRELLTNSQVERIVNDHQKVMTRFGYLTESGDLVY